MSLTLLGLPAEITTDHRFVIVDTAASAIQAQRLLPSQVVLWPPDGASLTDLPLEAWMPLNGSDVLLWPTNIPQARATMETVAQSVSRVTDRVRMLYVNGEDPIMFAAAAMADWTTGQLTAWAKARVRAWEPRPKTDPMDDLAEAMPPPRVSRETAQETESAQAEQVTALHFHDTDRANARRLALRHGVNARYAVEGKWLIWDGTRWALDHKGIDIQGLAKQTSDSIYDDIRLSSDQAAMLRHARRSQSKNAIESMVNLARSEPGIKCSLNSFDSCHWLLNVANGTLDLRSGELRPHTRDDLITRITPVEYYVEAECELWDSFLNYILNYDRDLYGYMKRLIGYLLTGQVTEQVLHFLYGMGANGKSVFCEVLAALLGDYAIIISPELLMQKRHGGGIPNDVARLRGARLAMMNETSQGARFDEAKLKDLTGSDSLSARFLHAEFFDFKPTHKLIIRGNHKPSISGTDEGIWRRLRLVPFTVQVPDDQQDKLLLSKLCAELPGILHWAVEGCLEWQRDGLNPPKVILDAVREYREESDTLGRFISECCTLSVLGTVKSSVFFKRYQEYSEQAAERWTSAKDLPHEMQRRGIRWKKTMHGNIYEGISLSQSEHATQKDWNDF